MADPFPYQETVPQTKKFHPNIINYHKTHAMAMCYGGVGDTSMENPENRDLDNDSQDNFQDENIIIQLICETK